jgi:BMFP domain-containing protein YqiC
VKGPENPPPGFQSILTKGTRKFALSGQKSPAAAEVEMTLSKRSIEMLLDLVEIKISYMDVVDREDARNLQVLERARVELRSLTGLAIPPEAMGARAGRPRVAA